MMTKNDKKALKPVTIITGGSEGIGKALAYEFAQGGHNLILLSRSKDKLETLQKDLMKDYQIKVSILVADLGQDTYLDPLDALLEREGFYVRYLVNNAGIGLAGSFHHRTLAETQQLLDVNISALTKLSYHYLPDMLARKEGGILNIASLGALIPGPYQAAYYASKSYVVSLTKALAYENYFSGVTFSALCPGPVKTGFHKKMGAETAHYSDTVGTESARKVARMGYSGLICGKTLVFPSVLNFIGAVALKLIPHDLLLPFMAWILKRRTK